MVHRQPLLDATKRRQIMSDGVQRDVPGKRAIGVECRPNQRWNIATAEEDAGVIISEHE